MEHVSFQLQRVVTQVLFDEKISQVLFGKDARLFAKELLQFTAWLSRSQKSKMKINW